MRLARLPLLAPLRAGVRPLRPSAPAPSGAVPGVGPRSLRRAIDSVADSPEFSTGHFGILAVTTRGDTLYSRNAGKLFMPASNQKLLTSSVALTLLDRKSVV